MIFTKKHTWRDDSSLENLLLFSQRMLELSFDKTDFIEKNISFCVDDIISECLDLITYSEKYDFEASENEFEILFEELKERIKNDDVSKKLLGEKKDKYLSALNSKADKKLIKNTLQILQNKLNYLSYFEHSKNIIKSLLETKEKNKLIIATTRFYEFLTSFGYQKGTIYFWTNKFFFDKSGENKINDINDVDEFFNFFDLEIKDFEVVFAGSNLFKEIETSCIKFGLLIEDTKTVQYDEAKERKFLHNENKKKIFITCKRIKAVDYLHAMKVASQRVSLVSDLFVVFHHQSKPWISDFCLVYNHKKEKVANIQKPSNLMSKANSYDLSDAKTIFSIFLDRFGLESDSFQRFNRGVELHSLSLNTDELASQILNLWICLETLLINERKKSHISLVSDAVMLIASNQYVVSKINSLTNLLLKWNKDKVDEIISKLPEDFKITQQIGIGALISVIDFKDLAGELLAAMDDQPLLRYKFMMLVKNYQKPSTILQEIESYEKRCKWDIRRVYRARNKIVHQGNINEHSDYIVETAHYYLDTILHSIIERKIQYNDIHSIDNLLQELHYIKTHQLSFYSSVKDKKVDINNFIPLLFGPDQ